MMKKLLVVVDYQNDFVNGSLGFSGAEKLDERICKKIEQYREEGADVAFTFDTHDENYDKIQEGRLLPIAHCVKSTEGWKLYGKTANEIKAKDKCFIKHSFGSAEMFEYLKRSDYESVEFAGLVSNICVAANAVLAKTALPEAEIKVDSMCTASGDEKLNAEALDVLRGMQIIIS